MTLTPDRFDGFLARRSRLGCQVKVTKDMQDTTITLPSATRNLRVDGTLPFLCPPAFPSIAGLSQS